MSFVAPVTSYKFDAFGSQWFRAWVWVATSIWLASIAQAQDTASSSASDSSADPFSGVEEMVVVGTGAAALLQAQEVSAIKFDASYLEALGATDLSDVAQFTPNLEIRTPFAASNPTLFIRGVGIRDFNANSSSSVAVYNDEIYMNSPAGQLAQLFDVEAVDVLRGPQTTTYARNASAGTIRVVTKKPTGHPEARLRATYGRFNQVQVEGAVENVLVPDLISMRTAARFNMRDGITRNRCADPHFTSDPGQANQFVSTVFNYCFATENTNPNFGLGWTAGRPAPVKEWVNDQNNWGARTLLRLEKDFDDVAVDVVLNFHGGQNRGDARQFQMVGARQNNLDRQPNLGLPADARGYFDADNRIIPPGQTAAIPIKNPFIGNPYEGDYDNIQKEKIDLFGTNLVGTIDAGAFKLTTITGYEWNRRAVELDLDASPLLALEPVFGNRSYQLTEELRLDYDADQGIRWQLGGMFLYEALQVHNQFILGASSVFAPTLDQSYGFYTRAGGAWVNAAWEPAETFKVEGGARVNYDDKELNLRTFRIISGIPDPVDPRLQPTPNSAVKKVGVAGDLKGTWTPIEDVSFYVRYARGYKGPHINGGVISPTPSNSPTGSLTTPVDPEEIDSVEIGMKGVFWGNRLTTNWALFYYDYNNIQIFRLRNAAGVVPVQQLINAKDADVLGVEAEFDVKPFEDWGPRLLDQFWLHATFAWLDSTYTDFAFNEAVDNGNGGKVTFTENFSGNRMINAPRFSFVGFAAWPVGGDWGTLIPRLDWTFKDKVFFDVSNSSLLKQDPLWLLNFRLIYKAPSDNFEISGWVENLTDQAYTVDVFNLARVRGSILHAVGDPRTYGVTATVKF